MMMWIGEVVILCMLLFGAFMLGVAFGDDDMKGERKV